MKGKHYIKRPRNVEASGSSSAPSAKNAPRKDPYYSPTLQASRLVKFQGRKQTYIRYADISWMVEQCFEFPHQLEMQGANTFLEMNGTYVSLRNTNHARPTVNDLKLMFAIREGILVNLSAEILKVIFGIVSSSTRLLAYDIFISMIINHLEIDTSDVDFIVTNFREHLISDNLIHKMGIYNYG
ncbi:hypothetical protein Lal_00014120 [Lupinus albus]|nr:hypothetical protein Lal_00014120 [Lupinus albus]